MSQRRLYLDDAPGERRGVVALDGLPERLLIERFDQPAIQEPGARAIARVRRIERALGSAFVDLGEGPDGLLSLTETLKGVTEGGFLDVEVVSAARRGKGAVLKAHGLAEGPFRLLTKGPDLMSRLQSFAPNTKIEAGQAARSAADVAEAAAEAIEHALPSGGRIFVEPTQALTAVDVDLGRAQGDGRRAQARANLEAISTAARLLRLKGLGGLVAIDLAGKGHDGALLSSAAKAAFAVDGAGVSIGPISRFGVLELVLPRFGRAFSDVILGADGQISSVSLALRMLRQIERAAAPGVRVEAACSPEIAAAAEALAAELVGRIGSRFAIVADPALGTRGVRVRAL